MIDMQQGVRDARVRITAFEGRIAPLSDQMRLEVAKRHLPRPCCRHMTLEEDKQKEIVDIHTYTVIVH